MNQPYTYMHPLPFVFPSHLGHDRALTRVLCAIQEVLCATFFFFFLIFIYFYFDYAGLHCCATAFSSCSEWGLLSSCGAQGFSCEA